MAHYHWYSNTEVWLVVIPLFFAACFGLGLGIANRSDNRESRSHKPKKRPPRRVSW
jgi:hypothetical protein